MKKQLILCGVIMLLNGCSSAKLSMTDAVNLLKGKWLLQSLTGQNDLSALFPGKLPALQFDTQAMQVSGNNGCNSLRGPFQLKAGGKLSFGPLAGTKMACPGQGESIFMTALNKVTSFKIDNGIMKLLADGQELMSLAKENE